MEQHWTWTPEAVSPHGLPLEVMTTLSEPGWPRCPNDLMTKTIKAVERPLRNRIYAFGEQRSEALQQGVTLVSRAGVGMSINVYRFCGAADASVGTVDEAQVSEFEVRPKGSSESRMSESNMFVRRDGVALPRDI